jgi:hypothetical protein
MATSKNRFFENMAQSIYLRTAVINQNLRRKLNLGNAQPQEYN